MFDIQHGRPTAYIAELCDCSDDTRLRFAAQGNFAVIRAYVGQGRVTNVFYFLKSAYVFNVFYFGIRKQQ